MAVVDFVQSKKTLNSYTTRRRVFVYPLVVLHLADWQMVAATGKRPMNIVIG